MTPAHAGRRGHGGRSRLSGAAPGPHVRGILVGYSAMSLVPTVFSHRHAGPTHAIRLRGGVAGELYAFSAFCFTRGDGGDAAG
ncbi:hypothetical protein ABC383_27035 [Noviherbaspirillum sp. 1P10PC]|uniref:hypothetical protein n=1 Tax=Noviherbaspirillum sp. 1P10PC TaxID=3132292 RepID=UPI00399F0A61